GAFAHCGALTCASTKIGFLKYGILEDWNHASIHYSPLLHDSTIQVSSLLPTAAAVQGLALESAIRLSHRAALSDLSWRSQWTRRECAQPLAARGSPLSFRLRQNPDRTAPCAGSFAPQRARRRSCPLPSPL